MEMDRNSPDGLDCVSVNGNTVAKRNACKTLDWLNRPRFIIREHKRCQARPFVKSCSHKLGIGKALGINWRPVDLKVLSF
jgi:hypothetical protein